MKDQTQIRQNENSGQDRSMRNLQPGRSMAPPTADLQAGDGFLVSTVGRGGENRPEDLRKLGQFLYDNHAPLAMVADLMNAGKNGDLIERYQSEVLGFSGPDGRIDPGGKTISAIRELKGREIVAGWYGKASESVKGKEAEAAPEIKKDVPQGLAISQSIGNGGVNNPEDLKALSAFLAQTQAPPMLIAGLTDPRYNGKIIEKYQKEVLGFRNPDGLIDPGGKTLGAIATLQGREIVAGWFTPKDSEKNGAEPEGGSKGMMAKPGEIPPVLSESQYFSQYNEGAPCVPLSLLKANLSKRNSEKSYRNVGCYQTCRYMLSQAGFSPGSLSDAEYLLEMETSGKAGKAGWQKSIGGLTDNFASSLTKLDESLMKGVPVIVGVNKNTKNFDWTNTKPDGTVSPTDHFVVIVGKTVTGDGRVAYRFYDPARYRLADGTSPKNLLVQEDNGQFTGNPYKSHNYSLGEIRATK